ncbi:MAG: hypothetical protein KGI00_04960 [Candidatus Micrarchaeota archaeon]|nr:hypothetical protein [Candidatus Micrarchaeota archaeon]
MATKRLRDLSVSELEKVIKEIKKPYTDRDKVWANRRKVTLRKMESDLIQLPLSTRAGGNKALLTYQTEEPNQDAHRRVKRLISNPPDIDIVIYDEDDEVKQKAQQLKDALKALYKWMNRGKIQPDKLATVFQQRDGLGILKLDFVADYADEALKNFDPELLEEGCDECDDENGDEEVTTENTPVGAVSRAQKKAKARYVEVKTKHMDAGLIEEEAAALAYKEVTDEALRRVEPPFRLSAPDPLVCYWTRDGDGIDTIVEVGKRRLSVLLETLRAYNVRLINNRLINFGASGATGDAIQDRTIPDNEGLDGQYDNLVDYWEIRTRTEIVIYIEHPKLLKGSGNSNISGSKKDGKGIVIGFDNPFGPYSTGYVLIPADITGSVNPADEFQPPILGSISLAQAQNILGTIRMSAAVDTALAGKYIKVEDAQPAPQITTSSADKTPTVKDGKPIQQIPGEVKREESPNLDLDKAEAMLAAMGQKFTFNEVLAGDATSADSGHKLAIQVSQADTQLVPYQNARAEALAEILMCAIYAVKKFGLPVYVKDIPQTQSGIMKNRVSPVQSVRAIMPDVMDIDFTLIVTIGSETPVTKFAKWSALEQRYRNATLSYETMMEQTDIENVADEIARVFEGQTLVAVMQQAIPIVVQMIAQQAVAKIMPPPGPENAVQQGGNENGGGMPGAESPGNTPIAGMGRLPGVGMSPAGPTTAEYGPRVNEGGGEIGTVSQ